MVQMDKGRQACDVRKWDEKGQGEHKEDEDGDYRVNVKERSCIGNFQYPPESLWRVERLDKQRLSYEEVRGAEEYAGLGENVREDEWNV